MITITHQYRGFSCFLMHPKYFNPSGTVGCFLAGKEVFFCGWNALKDNLMPPLNLTGAFYPPFTDNSVIYGDSDKACIQQTVEHLLSVETSSARPGMLFRKIQSGKTKTFLGAIAVAFNNGFDIAVILTKGTKALARQTLERVRRDFARVYRSRPVANLRHQTVPTALAGYELNQKLGAKFVLKICLLDRAL